MEQDLAPVQATESSATENASEAVTTGLEITQTSWSVNDGKQWINPGDVKFKVKYPKDYPQEKRHMPEGVTTISKQTAEQFEKLGIGKVIVN